MGLPTVFFLQMCISSSLDDVKVGYLEEKCNKKEKKTGAGKKQRLRGQGVGGVTFGSILKPALMLGGFSCSNAFAGVSGQTHLK